MFSVFYFFFWRVLLTFSKFACKLQIDKKKQEKMPVLSTKTFRGNMDEILITVPEKLKSKYISFFSLSGKPVYLQTPVVPIIECQKGFITISLNNEHFKQSLEEFEERCVNYIFIHSETFFNGKKFTREKVSNALQKLSTSSDGNLTLSLADSVLVKNQRGSEMILSDILPNTESINIIHIEGLIFKSNEIHFKCVISQSKVYIKDELKDWQIQNDSDSESDSEYDINENDVQNQIKAMELSRINESEMEKNNNKNDILSDVIQDYLEEIEKPAYGKEEKSEEKFEEVKFIENDDDKDFF